MRRAPGIPCALVFEASGLMQNSGAMRGGKAEVCVDVIACDKREAFAQGSKATKQPPSFLTLPWDCFADARNDEREVAV